MRQPHLRTAMLFVVVVVSALALPPAAQADRPGTELPACAPGVGLLGFSDALNKTDFEATAVGGLSDLVYDRQRKGYYVLPDRAPARIYTVRIPLDRSGQPITEGFDGEGLALTNQDELLVASEAAPSIRRYSLDGELLGTLPVPDRFAVAPAGGATANRAFESLALSPNGHSLFTAVEAPLARDGRTDAGAGRIRILRYDDRGPGGFAPAAQYFYRTEPGEFVVEIVALSADDLLVLERSFTPGTGNTIRIFRVSLDSATDVSDEPTLAADGLQPVDKTLLVDVGQCPPSGAETPGTQQNPLLDNYEGLALGPHLPGGRRALLLISDDNFNDVQVTRILALSVRLPTVGPAVRG